MYYLRTKSAVDAIKFTLNNDKAVEPISAQEPVEVLNMVQEPVAPIAVDDFKAMLARAQSAEPDDCEMCGS